MQAYTCVCKTQIYKSLWSSEGVEAGEELMWGGNNVNIVPTYKISKMPNKISVKKKRICFLNGIFSGWESYGQTNLIISSLDGIIKNLRFLVTKEESKSATPHTDFFVKMMTFLCSECNITNKECHTVMTRWWLKWNGQRCWWLRNFGINECRVHCKLKVWMISEVWVRVEKGR